MAMRFKPLALIVAGTAFTSCASVDPVSQSTDRGFGESVKYNTALQTIDPDPSYPADSAQPGENGETAQAAVERLRNDETRTRHQSEAASAKAGTISTTESTQSGGPQ
jgi:hypothetical protein